MRGAGGLLDRYVLRRFVGAYGLCVFGFVLLFLVVDFFGHLDNFLEGEKAIVKAGLTLWPVVGEFYLTRLPLVLTTLGPYMTLFAGVAVLITFARHNELVPMIAAGRSHHRVLAPVYGFAVLVVFGLVAMEERVLPYAMKRNAQIDALIQSGERGGEFRNPPHLRDRDEKGDGNVFDAQGWSSTQQKLVDVHAPRYHDPTGRLPDGRLDAAVLQYRRHPVTKVVGWYPKDATLTPFDADKGGVLPDPIRLPPDEAIAFSLTPREIDLQTEASEPGLTRQELAALVRSYPQKFDLQMQMLTRTTRPIASLVLLLLGLPFVLKPGHKSTIAGGLGVALGTCGCYVGVDFFFQQLGNRGDLEPLVAAWVAPAFFGAIALVRLDRFAD